MCTKTGTACSIRVRSIWRGLFTGLTELHRDDVSDADLVANPGCYPTASIMALAPAVDAGIIEGDVIIDAKSGVSGAGRGLSLKTHFSEVNENFMAYSVDGHRHLPEIQQELDQLDSGDGLKNYLHDAPRSNDPWHSGELLRASEGRHSCFGRGR